MSANPQFVAAPKVWTAALAVANSARDGTGTIVDVVTAGTNGSRIDRIEATALVTTAAGTIRFFIFDGATNRMWREITTTAVTPSGVQPPAFITPMFDQSGYNLPLLLLQPTAKLRAAITNNEAWNVIALGGDF